jgi:hypothetical protein
MNQILRQQVLERDNYTCLCCGATDKRLDTHHKVARRYGGTNSLDNIITVCTKCHKIIEPSRKMGVITNPTYRYIHHTTFTCKNDIEMMKRVKILALEKNTTATALLKKV